MAEKVEYEITLRDLLSDKVKDAESNVTHFEDKLKEVAGVIAAAFAVEKIIEFGKEILHTTAEFEGFTNVIKYASVDAQDGQKNLDYLGDAVKRLHLPMRQAYEQFSELQGGLYGTGVEGDKLRGVFEGVAEASTVLHMNADQFSRTGYALKEIGELGTLQTRQMRMLAMALPGAMNLAAESMNMGTHQFHEAMRKGEIDSTSFLQRFSAKLKEHFEGGLENAGNSLISKMNDTQTKLTQLELQMGEDLRPMYISIMSGLIDVLGFLKDMWEWSVKTAGQIKKWASDNKVALEMVGGAVVAGAAAWGIYNLVTNGAAIASGIRSVAFGIEAAVMYGLGTAVEFVNAAFIASPIGWIVTGIAAVTAGVIYCWNHFATFRAVLTGLWEFMKALFNWMYVVPVKVLMGLGEMIVGALSFSPTKISEGFNNVKNAFKEGAMDLATSFKKGYDEGMSNFAQAHPGEALIKNGGPILDTPKEKKGLAGHNTDTATVKAPKSSSSGTKNIKIDIKIGQLVGKFEVNSTTIQETASKIKEHVTNALISAVNDSQIVAGS